MENFSFIGKLAASKSILNRAHIVQSFNPYLKVEGKNQCDDVRALLRGLDQMHRGDVIDCEAGGTTFRFLALRASRLSGRHVLRGTSRLFSRPQEELIKILRQLSVEAKIEGNEFIIESQGWRPMGDGIHIHSDRSSQFASAVLLSAWNLNFALALSLGSKRVSEGYFDMTKKLVHELGMSYEDYEGDIRIPANQEITAESFTAEMDMSSVFSVAAIAAVSGQARFTQFPETSWQPDYCFKNILQYMNVPVRLENGNLIVEQASELSGVEVAIGDAPDLVPVLGALCALASGPSRLTEAHQLKFKESNRIEKTVELVEKMGRKAKALEDGIEILGEEAPKERKSFEFDPDEDHRLAMAVGVALKAGYPVALRHREVVTKSFPEFWQVIGI